MTYRMHINADEPFVTWRSDIGNIEIAVGRKYISHPVKATTKKDRENMDRVVEVIGFSDSFMGDAIIRYLDTGRRGRVRPNDLIPYKE